jgi:dihydrofolate reductase
MKKIAAIAAVSENYIIGRDGKLPWRLPADLKFFKDTTMGCPVISGRKSHEGHNGALPGRRNIVLSRNPTYDPGPDAELAPNLQTALAMCTDAPVVFVLGGETVFTEAVEQGIATHLILTRVLAHVEGDTAFPRFNESDWELEWEEFRPKDEKNGFDMKFQSWKRKALLNFKK